jgi:hypothetical protein
MSPCIEDAEDPDVGRDGGSDQAPALTFPTHLFTKPARYAERDQIANSVVKVFASVSRSFPRKPWTNESQLDCSGKRLQARGRWHSSWSTGLAGELGLRTLRLPPLHSSFTSLAGLTPCGGRLQAPALSSPTG